MFAKCSFMLGSVHQHLELLALLAIFQLRIGARERAFKSKVGPCRFPCNGLTTLRASDRVRNRVKGKMHFGVQFHGSLHDGLQEIELPVILFLLKVPGHGFIHLQAGPSTHVMTTLLPAL